MFRKPVKRQSSLQKKFPEGMKFQCQYGCRKCCEIPGVVYVGSWEAPPMAELLGVSEEEFFKKYLRKHWADVYELKMSDEEPCMFLRDNGCAIYEARPLQCSTFPFWPDHLKSAKIWDALRGLCPGIGRGHRYSWEEIEQISDAISFGPFL